MNQYLTNPELLTPELLIDACVSQRQDLIQVLLKRGVDTNHHDCEGNTPLFHVVCNGDVDTARLLLQQGALTNQRNLDGKTPLYMAIISNNIKMIKLLMEHGADMNLPVSWYLPIYHSVHICIMRPIPLEPSVVSGTSLLLLALHSKYSTAAEVLASYPSADIHAVDSAGQAPLLLASRSRRYAKVYRALLSKQQIDVETTDKKGNFPLYAAVTLGNSELVSLLLNCGADPVRKVEELSVFDYACRRSNLEVIFHFIRCHPHLCSHRFLEKGKNKNQT